MKKSIILLAVFLLVFQIANAQEDSYPIHYTYDDAGNRKTRVHYSSATATNDGAAINETLNLVMLDDLVVQTQNQEKSLAKDAKSNTSFKVFPNPTKDKITISHEVPKDEKNKAVIILLDTKGKILDRIPANNASTTLDIQHLAKGVYYVYFFFDSAQNEFNEVERMAWQIVKE